MTELLTGLPGYLAGLPGWVWFAIAVFVAALALALAVAWAEGNPKRATTGQPQWAGNAQPADELEAGEVRS